mmetsp:Transcript_58376/g.186091  ORF Transcript_58376/g.186091 Transcript_58376/m.186091 type:complete len:227 (+) Transcript_58376:286-966(+)
MYHRPTAPTYAAFKFYSNGIDGSADWPSMPPARPSLPKALPSPRACAAPRAPALPARRSLRTLHARSPRRAARRSRWHPRARRRSPQQAQQLQPVLQVQQAVPAALLAGASPARLLQGPPRPRPPRTSCGGAPTPQCRRPCAPPRLPSRGTAAQRWIRAAPIASSGRHRRDPQECRGQTRGTEIRPQRLRCPMTGWGPDTLSSAACMSPVPHHFFLRLSAEPPSSC